MDDEAICRAVSQSSCVWQPVKQRASERFLCTSSVSACNVCISNCRSRPGDTHDHMTLLYAYTTRQFARFSSLSRWLVTFCWRTCDLSSTQLFTGTVLPKNRPGPSKSKYLNTVGTLLRSTLLLRMRRNSFRALSQRQWIIQRHRFSQKRMIFRWTKLFDVDFCRWTADNTPYVKFLFPICSTLQPLAFGACMTPLSSCVILLGQTVRALLRKSAWKYDPSHKIQWWHKILSGRFGLFNCCWHC